MDSNLLDLTGCLSIRQVLGARLTKTCDSLTALTRQVLEGVQELPETEPAPAAEEEKTPAALPAAGGVLRIDIAEGKDIHIEIPLGGVSAAVSNTAAAVSAAPEQPPRLVRSLKRKHFKVTEVRRGPETRLEGTVLYIREGIEKDCVASQALVYDLKIDIITPDAYHTYSETIMDVQPIAAKEGESELGSGVTRVLDGVIMMVTGTDANGVQIGEFGSSEGYLDENIVWGRPGAPDKGEIFIKTQVTVKEHTNMERPGPMAAHAATDVITQEIREALKRPAMNWLFPKKPLSSTAAPAKRKWSSSRRSWGRGPCMTI